jgi:hypothetical protein
MRAAVVAVALVAAGLIGAGCKKPRTEMVVVVQTEGVRVPEDVAQIRVLVADRESGGDTPVYDSTVSLCTPTLTTGCYTLPLSAVLHPGSKQPDDPVKVQIDALSRTGVRVTSSAALFTFSPKQSLRLDFILYSNCIGLVDCSVRDQACGPDAKCTTLTPVKLEDDPDLGLGGGGGSGGSGGGDMSLPPPVRDLSMAPGSDLASSDMSSVDDMAMPLPLFDMATMSCAISCDMVAPPTSSSDFGPVMSGDDGFMSK